MFISAIYDFLQFMQHSILERYVITSLRSFVDFIQDISIGNQGLRVKRPISSRVQIDIYHILANP